MNNSNLTKFCALGVILTSFFTQESMAISYDNIARNYSSQAAKDPIANKYDENLIFASGSNDTHTYRIPAIITAKNGDILVACDARYTGSKDLMHVRKIDIVLRRSTDNGKTWLPLQKIAAFGEGKPASDPSFVLNPKTGEIFCFFNYMDQDKSKGEFRLMYISSKNNGKTWSKTRDITEQIIPKGWEKNRFKFITSGRGTFTKDGKILHTLVDVKGRGVYVFGSANNGKSWRLYSDIVKPADESKIIELANGNWMINSRVQGLKYRYAHISKDKGKTWTSTPEQSLIDPACNGSIIHFKKPKASNDKTNYLLFSNANATSRRNLGIKYSADNGKTWSAGKVIDSGEVSYSDLTVLKDGSIGVVYEPGNKTIKGIQYLRINFEDLK